MPITNRSRYGFRLVRGTNGNAAPTPMMMHIASAYADRIRIGDPVRRVADGSIEIAAAGNADIFGVVTGGGYYYDGTNVVPAKFVPGGTTWGTVWDRRSRMLVTPCEGSVFEVDVNDNVTATTAAGYAALEGGNADHAIGATGDADATPVLNISTIGTVSAQWRVLETSRTVENEDFAGENVKLLVVVNETRQAPYQTTGI